MTLPFSWVFYFNFTFTFPFLPCIQNRWYLQVSLTTLRLLPPLHYHHRIVFFVVVVVVVVVSRCLVRTGFSFFVLPSLGHNGFTARAFDTLLSRAHVHSVSKPKPNLPPPIHRPDLNHCLLFTFPSNQHLSSCSTQSDPRSSKH